MQAIDVVRNRVMKGEPYRAENAQRTALELKKFLSSGASARERAGIGERERLRGELAVGESRLQDEQSFRIAAEIEADSLRAQIAALETHVDALGAADAKKQTALDELTGAIELRDRRAARNWAIALTLCGVVVVLQNSFIAGTINVQIPTLGPHWKYLLSAVRAVGLLTVAMPWTIFIRRSKWRTDYQIVALTALYAAVYALFPGVADGWKTIFSDPLGWIALLVTVLLARRTNA